MLDNDIHVSNKMHSTNNMQRRCTVQEFKDIQKNEWRDDQNEDEE